MILELVVKLKESESLKCQIWKNSWGGGELLLTSMRAYEATEEDVFLHHLKELDKKQISGFIVKRKQNTAHLNKLFETLVCFCEEHNIPVLELPQDISYCIFGGLLSIYYFSCVILKLQN